MLKGQLKCLGSYCVKIVWVEDLVLCLQAASGSDDFWFSTSGSSVGCVLLKSEWLDLLGMLSYNTMEDLEFGTADAI